MSGFTKGEPRIEFVGFITISARERMVKAMMIHSGFILFFAKTDFSLKKNAIAKPATNNASCQRAVVSENPQAIKLINPNSM